MEKLTAAQQIFSAGIFGTYAYRHGIKCAPCLDKNLMDMIEGREVGKTPEGEAATVKLMKVWTENWTLASLNA